MSLDNEVDSIIIGYKNTPFYELSPTYYSTFIASGKKWRTLVHFWVANYFSDEFMKDWVRNQDTYQMAINCARSKGFKDFNQIDSKYLIYGIQERFNQNDQLRNILLSTGSVQIVYGGAKNYLSENNRYGRMLMRIRELYQE